MHVPPSLQQLKAQARTRAAAHCAPPDTPRAEARKRQAAWYAEPPTTTHWTPPSNNPGQMAHYCNVWGLGYCTREELQEASRGKCATTARCHPSPTGALPPDLPCHRPPEARPGPRRPACRWGLLMGVKAGPPSGPPHPERRDVGGAASNAPSPLTHHSHTPPRPGGDQ
ncbi:hypothetical protein GWK47_041815 [Chionoecetes opilio]|uniref:Uncharacterized protein n=1 Tax=Chionoecetes opilio TaxID=41210 RepID=A0A8J5CWN0_CHIOP|nr:hypothetical protein GWK47_041815 [Chionoecetes opilio]